MTLFDFENGFFGAILFFLYAEIHYRFPGVFSRLFKKEPEIITDVPHRLEPGKKLPVLLFVKDADKYPVILKKMNVDVYVKDKKYTIFNHIFNGEKIQTQFADFLFQAGLPDVTGPVRADIVVEYEINGKIRTCHNDNYAKTSHEPFTVLVDENPLPKSENWYYGDLHYHSFLTSDQVEFGAPLHVTAKMADAMGIDFVAVTDHSYDLDDRWDDYLQNDDSLPKWNYLQETVQKINSEQKKPLLLAGEEVSVGNCQNKNVHMLVIKDKQFYPGKGDSAEKWLKTEPDMSVTEICQKSVESMAVAAHPEITPPFLQRLLIRRGKWQYNDYTVPGLDGLQIWNSEKDRAFRKGIKVWTRLLLDGYRLSIYAGNDAHGSFGRFRQIKTPFTSMKEGIFELFGKAKTIVLVKNGFTLENIISALKKGRCVITDGPFAEFQLLDDNKNVFEIGDCFSQKQGKLVLNVLSTPAFGKIDKVVLYTGSCRTKKETRTYLNDLNTPGSYTFQYEIDLFDLPERGYLRIQVISSNHLQQYLCLTNPVYVDTRTI